MKKKSILLLLLGVLFLTGCNRKSATVDDFAKTFNNSNCEVTDYTDKYENNDNIKSMLEAACDDYEIEFYILKTEDYAKDVFKENYTEFKKDKTGTNLEKLYSKSNYNIYSLTCGGKFRYISRIDNTLVYVYTDEDNKKEASKYIDALGY